MNNHRYKHFGYYRKISDLAGKNNLLSHTRDMKCFLKVWYQMSFTLYRPICPLKWQEGTPSLNLFNPMQTIIGYKAPNFMNCIKLVHKALSVSKTNSISPSLPAHPYPTSHTQPCFHSVLLPTSLRLMLGPGWGPHLIASQPTPFILALGWNWKQSQRRELIQSLTLETLPLKTKINSAIESIGHINTSTVSNFIHNF